MTIQNINKAKIVGSLKKANNSDKPLTGISKEEEQKFPRKTFGNKLPTTDFRSYKQKEKKNIINNLKQINFKNKLISREATFTKDKIKTLIVLQILKIIEMGNHLLSPDLPKNPRL